MKTVKQAADILECSKWAIYKQIKEKRKIGQFFKLKPLYGEYMITENDLKKYVGGLK